MQHLAQEISRYIEEGEKCYIVSYTTKSINGNSNYTKNNRTIVHAFDEEMAIMQILSCFGNDMENNNYLIVGRSEINTIMVSDIFKDTENVSYFKDAFKISIVNKFLPHNV